ncbi:uncharacterized protein LOC34620673 [Cyclospora cayetanensis]|uniref:Uncharacterized protein LOC34620673 n=1 Tax=Cyclospora cayetanensis TaxID=88456 RepID=A0A6P6S3G0_9EIME|nr:uncharacterized protein LOC34620673 [Cyclospora cayetanensis]
MDNPRIMPALEAIHSAVRRITCIPGSREQVCCQRSAAAILGNHAEVTRWGSLVGAAGEEQTPGVPAALYVQARTSPLLADGSPQAEIRQDPDLQYPHETGKVMIYWAFRIRVHAAAVDAGPATQRWKGLPTGVPQPEEESLMPKSLEITQKWTSAALRILPDVSQAATASVVEGKADLNENSFWRDPQRNTERHQSEAAVASRLSLIEEFRRFSRQHVGGGGDPWSLLSRHRGAADPIGPPQNVQALGNILERPPERVRGASGPTNMLQVERAAAAAAAAGSPHLLIGLVLADGSVWGIDDLRAGFQEALQQSSLLPPTRGGAMLKRLEADCERASRGTRQRAEEFAKFIDQQMAELEELATESARLQAEVKELNTKTEQNLQEVEALLEEDKARAVDSELARVAAAKEKVELRLQAAKRKLDATRKEFMVVSRQDLHARKEWRSRVDAYKFTHGIRIHQQRGKPFTRICFLGLYKELAQLECHLDVSLEDQSCQDLIAVSKADIQCIHDPKNASPPYAPAFLVSDCIYLDLEFALALVRGSTLTLSLDSMLSFSRLCLHLILAKPLLPPLCPRNPHLAAAAPVSSATAAHDCIAIPLPFWDVPVMYSLARVLFDLFFLCDSVVGAWPEAPLSELCALYAEGRVSFTALVSHSRLIFKAQLTRMSHAQKLVALHEQQRQRGKDKWAIH